ncbi:MAG: hypothetical protein J6N53_00560 [Lachnospiraceae bacterium]|nr:hypothetical protein [Lachnospiraceae bacterium]MBP3296755.1 hypothetical protein [Lachnospiraceae bacterium]
MKVQGILSKGFGLILSAVISLSPIMSQAAPKTMPDGTIFDPEFYAATYPDVAAVCGNDEALLYQHYVLCGKNEGRLPYAPQTAVSISAIRSGSADLKVDYHTKEEIALFIKSNPVGGAYVMNYSSLPVTEYPYSLGAVDPNILNDTCRLLNIYRYIAGIPAVITLNESYNEYAQAAAVVNAANEYMTHYPVQPDWMSNEMYQKGRKGAGSSNLGDGYRSLGDALATGWMSDDDYFNIDRVGHRRWALNPTMAQTGFGYADGMSAMYAFDSKNGAGNNYKRVVWPAQNTPVGYFAQYDPWSISMGESVSNATVTLTCLNTGQVWVFSGTPNCNMENEMGYFNINNGSYGQTGCIIFRPWDGVNVSKGYSYQVSVSGKAGRKDFSLQYTVDFFDVANY